MFFGQCVVEMFFGNSVITTLLVAELDVSPSKIKHYIDGAISSTFTTYTDKIEGFSRID